MATFSKQARFEVSNTGKLLLFLAVFVVAAILAGTAASNFPGLTDTLLVSVTEPARPDLEALVSCGLDSPVVLVGSYGEDALTIRKSKLNLIAKNAGKADAKTSAGVIPVKYELTGFDQGEISARGIATAGTYDSGELSGTCLAGGLAEGEACQLSLLDGTGKPVNNLAPRGTFTLKVDEVPNDVQGRVLEEDGREINRDSDFCAGTVLTDCFTLVPERWARSMALYCPEDCKTAGSVGGSSSCGGCDNPARISQADLDKSDPVCTGCCECPSLSFIKSYWNGPPRNGQVFSGENCGRLLPDLAPHTVTVKKGKIEGYVINIGYAQSAETIIDIYIKFPASTDFEFLTSKKIGSLVPYGLISGKNEDTFKFDNNVITSGMPVKVVVDPNNRQPELDETNNELRNDVPPPSLPDIRIADTYSGSGFTVLLDMQRQLNTKFTICARAIKNNAIVYKNMIKFEGELTRDKAFVSYGTTLPLDSKVELYVDCKRDVWEGARGERNNYVEDLIES